MQPDIKVHCTIILVYVLVKNNTDPTYKNLTYHKSLNQNGKNKWC